MPISAQTYYDHTKFVLDPQRDGKDEWNQISCTWLKDYIFNNPKCPWDDESKTVMGVELLGAGLPLQNWVGRWKTAPDLKQVWFKFYPTDEWNLEIGAYVGAHTSATEYRVLDIARKILGVDDAGNLTHMVKGRIEPAAKVTLASPAPPLVPATPQQVATAVADANSHLKAVGANVAAALDRLQKVATEAALSGAVGRTRAALDQLVKVAAKTH